MMSYLEFHGHSTRETERTATCVVNPNTNDFFPAEGRWGEEASRYAGMKTRKKAG